VIASFNVCLKKYNTFGLEVKAKELVEIHSLENFRALLPRLKSEKFVILGGGSNVLFINDFDGLVVVNKLKGISSASMNQADVLVTALSGESWHDFVLWTLERGFFGLENMSLIPGTVGAAPMQNIGAYGAELKDICVQVDVVDLETGKIKAFSNEECGFGYRESVFKRQFKDKYFVYKVHLKLSRASLIKADYGNIQAVLKSKGILFPTHQDVSNAVMEIRCSKLPNPKELGNAGSFFKNPIVEQSKAENILKSHPNAPHFPDGDRIKIPAGWLIEQCGFKGVREGNVGCYKDQALIIVNYGDAVGSEVYEYSEKIIEAVRKKFDLVLEREVNVIF